MRKSETPAKGVASTKRGEVQAEDIFDFADDVGFLLADATRMLRSEFDRRASAYGLTGVQWRVICYLAREDGMTQSELAQELEKDPTSIGRTIDRLERGGFVARQRVPHDGRAWKVVLRPKGWEVGPKLMVEEAARLYDELLESASLRERECFVRVLKIILGKLIEMSKH